MTLRVLIADDHALLRGALRTLLQDELGATDVRQAETLHRVLQILAVDTAFDLLIIDLVMPGVEGVASIAALFAIAPKAKIVVMSALDDRASAITTLTAGLYGFIPKSLSAAKIAIALKDVLAGRVYAPDLLARPPSDSCRQNRKWPAQLSALTSRQKDVLEQVVYGASNKQIAHKLGIATRTVKVHLSAIYRAASVTSRSQLIARLTRDGGG